MSKGMFGLVKNLVFWKKRKEKGVLMQHHKDIAAALQIGLRSSY